MLESSSSTGLSGAASSRLPRVLEVTHTPICNCGSSAVAGIAGWIHAHIWQLGFCSMEVVDRGCWQNGPWTSSAALQWSQLVTWPAGTQGRGGEVPPLDGRVHVGPGGLIGGRCPRLLLHCHGPGAAPRVTGSFTSMALQREPYANKREQRLVPLARQQAGIVWPESGPVAERPLGACRDIGDAKQQPDTQGLETGALESSRHRGRGARPAPRV